VLLLRAGPAAPLCEALQQSPPRRLPSSVAACRRARARSFVDLARRRTVTAVYPDASSAVVLEFLLRAELRSLAAAELRLRAECRSPKLSRRPSPSCTRRSPVCFIQTSIVVETRPSPQVPLAPGPRNDGEDLHPSSHRRSCAQRHRWWLCLGRADLRAVRAADVLPSCCCAERPV
jgi:hypothetical protein